MKALIMKAYDCLTYEDVPLPAVGERDVLVRVKACAVCGGDIHGIDGSTGRRVPPIIMGHEASGVIETAGAAVTRFKPGDRVTFDSMLNCGTCTPCRRGEPNLCTRLQVMGVTHGGVTRNGAFAEFVSVPEHVLYHLPDAVPFLDAALVEPLSVAYHAVSRFPAPQGGVAVVVGVGTIGLLIVQVLKSMGVRRVIAVDIQDDRLKTALENGADAAVNSRTAAARAAIRAAAAAEIDAAYDATGLEATVNLCLDVVRAGGRVGLIGNLSPEIRFPLQTLVTRQISIFGSYASAGVYRQCLDLIAAKKVNVWPLISKVAPMSQGNEWIHRLYNREPWLLKVIFVPDAH